MAAADYNSIPTHVTRVLSTRRAGPNYVEVTVGGGLDGFQGKGPDDFVYVLLPPPGRSELTIGTDFSWTAFYEMPEAERPVGAYYTVRRHRQNEIDIDVFLHDPAGSVSDWATRCVPGAPVALWGPRTAWAPPDDTDSWLLVADETGLPAVSRIIESAPFGMRVDALVEIATCDDVVDLDADVVWLPRNGRPVGETARLLDAVRNAAFGGRTPYVWGGGESRAMSAVRRLVRCERGLPQERVSLTPYWRRAATDR